MKVSHMNTIDLETLGNFLQFAIDHNNCHKTYRIYCSRKIAMCAYIKEIVSLNNVYNFASMFK